MSAPLAVGAAACPRTGTAAAAVNVTSKRKFRRRTFMLPSLWWFRPFQTMLHPLRVRLKVLAVSSMASASDWRGV